MVRVVSSKTVNLPHEKVFSTIKEIDKLPTLFPDKYKSFKVVERSDNHILTEEIVSISGKEIKQKVQHSLEPDRRLKSEVVEGDTRGTILIIELDPKSESSTEIKIDADLKYGKIGAMLGIFAKRKIKNEMDKLIDQISKK
ncbi:MAG TPA: SRPBCC family protein [Nitrososphaeraceae archaeon]|jgi:carbon monoxide dehydrogenase subunit G|nr:SRPBCC family protein [Nitrososphaeraceae archaeon]